MGPEELEKGRSRQELEYELLDTGVFDQNRYFDVQAEYAKAGDAAAADAIEMVIVPRARDLGPILIAWLASLGVLVFERDLGSSLLFFGLKPDSTVVEISPSAGWYTEVLAPALNDRGHYIAAIPKLDGNAPEAMRKNESLFRDKLASNPALYGKATVNAFDPAFIGNPAQHRATLDPVCQPALHLSLGQSDCAGDPGAFRLALRLAHCQPFCASQRRCRIEPQPAPSHPAPVATAA